MNYEQELNFFLEELHQPEPEPVTEPEPQVVEEVVEPVRLPKTSDKLEEALNKRRAIKEHSEKQHVRPVLKLGKEVINYGEVVEVLGLGRSSEKKVDMPTPVVEEVQEELIVEEFFTLPEPEPVQSFVDMMAQSLSDYAERTGTKDVKKELDLYEDRFNTLERHLVDMRRLILESASSNRSMHDAMFSPGSGEVRTMRMDDVASQTIQPGDALVWDGTQFVGGRTTNNTDLEEQVQQNTEDIEQLREDVDRNTLDIQVLYGLAGEIQQSMGVQYSFINDNIDLIYAAIGSLVESQQLFKENVGTQYTEIWEKLVSIDERFESIPNSEGGFLRLEDFTISDGEPSYVDPQFFDTVPDGDTTRFIVTKDPQRGVYCLDGYPQPTVEVPRGDILEFDISGLTNPETFGIYKNGVVLEHGVYRDDVIGLVTVRTGEIPSEITKFYYKDTVKKGLGWVVNIIDY